MPPGLSGLSDSRAASDLEANQRGEITDSQRSQLRRRTIGRGLNEILPWPIAGALVIALVLVDVHVFSPDRLPPGALVAVLVIGIASLVPARKPLLNRWTVMRDLAAGIVAHDEGTAAWGGKQYVGVLDDGRRMVEKEKPEDALRLRPGRYIFHYLPRSRTILSAQRRSIDPDSDRLILKSRAGTLRFNGRVLGENRNGQVVARQMIRLLGAVTLHAVIALVMSAAVVALVVFAIRGELPATGIFAIVVAAPVAWLTGRQCVREVYDAIAHGVEAGDGAVSAMTRRRKNSRYYVFVFDGDEFEVSLKAYNALVEDVPYRVYRLARSKEFLSMEPLTLVTMPVRDLNI